MVTDRIEEIESQMEALKAELQKRKEYNDLVKQVENPCFEEFLNIANKFVSQFEGEIPLKQGTVDTIKISYYAGKWKVRYNLKPAIIGGTIYDIYLSNDIDSKIEEHITHKRDRMLSDRALYLSESEELDNKIEEIDKDLKEFEGKIKEYEKKDE